VVEYGHMTRYAGKSRVYFDEGVKVDFYDAAGRKRSQLTAQAGELLEVTNDIVAIGQVKVVSDTGITVLTDRLAYNQKTEKIFSELDVTIITSQGDTLYGTGFESDTQLHFWQIKKPRGISHSSLDLSGEQFRKEKVRPDSAVIKK